jgi:hypothetical protein
MLSRELLPESFTLFTGINPGSINLPCTQGKFAYAIERLTKTGKLDLIIILPLHDSNKNRGYPLIVTLKKL